MKKSKSKGKENFCLNLSISIIYKLRPQIMSRAEYFLGNKLFHRKFTTTTNVFFHGVQTNYNIYMNNKKIRACCMIVWVPVTYLL